MSADGNRGVPLVSHRLYDDTFAFLGSSGQVVVVSREDAILVADELAHLLESDPPPSADVLDPPFGVQTS